MVKKTSQKKKQREGTSRSSVNLRTFSLLIIMIVISAGIFVVFIYLKSQSPYIQVTRGWYWSTAEGVNQYEIEQVDGENKHLIEKADNINAIVVVSSSYPITNAIAVFLFEGLENGVEYEIILRIWSYSSSDLFIESNLFYNDTYQYSMTMNVWDEFHYISNVTDLTEAYIRLEAFYPSRYKIDQIVLL